jgi:L-amino acid N-acyltransferase YncA
MSIIGVRRRKSSFSVSHFRFFQTYLHAGPASGEIRSESPKGSHILMNVRLATPADIAALVKVGHRIHSETRYAAYDYNLERVTVNLTDIVCRQQDQHGTHAVFIADDHRQEIVGVLIGAIERHIFSDLPVANMLVYYVFPDKRMSGAGFKLLTAFRRWAENGAAFEVCASINSAVHLERSDRFLVRLGFLRTGGNYSLRTRSIRPALNRQVAEDEY